MTFSYFYNLPASAGADSPYLQRDMALGVIENIQIIRDTKERGVDTMSHEYFHSLI